MSKNTVLVLDSSICYFGFAYSCKYKALPMSDRHHFMVIDIKRDGLEVDKSKTYIIRKFFGDSTYKLNGWIGKDEGILVVDKDEIAELRKSMDHSERSWLSYTYLPSTVLKAFDYNKDMVLDNDDPGFKAFYIWRDVNQDMICHPDEVVPISALEISSIELEKKPCSDADTGYCGANSINSDTVTCNSATGTLEIVDVDLFRYAD